MLLKYFTIKSHGIHEIVIQKSRFITHVNRAETEEEAQAFIQSVKKEHWNATHNCSAYLIGEHNQIQKANDDGEPGGTTSSQVTARPKHNRCRYYIRGSAGARGHQHQEQRGIMTWSQ